MSNVSEAFEKLQENLAVGEMRAERLARLLFHPLDEAGRPSAFVMPEARSLLTASLIRASEAAADIGIELFDVRWNAVVALLHNASTCVRTATGREAGMVATLLGGLRVRTTQLRHRRETGEVKVRLFN